MSETIIMKAMPVVDSYTCDDCKRVISVEDEPFEAQEMLHWRDTGGFASVFGDGVSLSLDLCQHCLKKRLGDVIRREESSRYFVGCDRFEHGGEHGGEESDTAILVRLDDEDGQ